MKKLLVVSLVLLSQVSMARSLVCNTPANNEGIEKISFSSSLGQRGDLDRMTISMNNARSFTYSAKGLEMISTLGFGTKFAIFKNSRLGYNTIKYKFVTLEGDRRTGSFGKRSGVRVSLIRNKNRYKFECILN